jgi:MFS family permease
MGSVTSGRGHRRQSRTRLPTRLVEGVAEFPAQFWLLMGGTFIYVIGVDMCYPFETLYLNGGLHIPIATVGLVIGLVGFAGLPFQLLGGAVADRIGRRGVLMVGICGSMTLYIGLGLAHGLLVVTIVFFLEAAFGWSMFITATNAMAADLVHVPRRAEAFGIGRAAINSGMVIGPLIAWLFLGPRPAFRTLFIAAGAVCGMFLVIVLLWVRETRPLGSSEASLRHTFSGYGHILRDRRFLLFCLVALLPLYGFGQIFSTFPVALHDALGASARQWAVLLLVWALSASILQYPVVHLLRRRDPLLLLAASSALLGIGLGAAPLAPLGWVTFALMLVVSLGVVLLMPVAQAVVAALAPVRLRGRYMSAWTIAYLGGSALGPTFGGYAIHVLGARQAFLVVGGAGLCGAALFPLLRIAAGPLAAPIDESAPDTGLEQPPLHVP